MHAVHVGWSWFIHPNVLLRSKLVWAEFFCQKNINESKCRLLQFEIVYGLWTSKSKSKWKFYPSKHRSCRWKRRAWHQPWSCSWRPTVRGDSVGLLKYHKCFSKPCKGECKGKLKLRFEKCCQSDSESILNYSLLTYLVIRSMNILFYRMRYSFYRMRYSDVWCRTRKQVVIMTVHFR